MRITKQMKQRAEPPKPPTKEKKEPERMCANCMYAVPDTKEHLRNSDGAPIMCSCRYQKHKMLLRHDVCPNHEFDILA